MPSKFGQFKTLSDEELQRQLERAERLLEHTKGLRGADKGGKRLKQAQYLRDEIQREIADRDGFLGGTVPEILSASRSAARTLTSLVSAGQLTFDDNAYANVAAFINSTTAEEELERIAQQKETTKDNKTGQFLASAAAAVAASVAGSTVVGQGATRLATAARQGAFGAYETVPAIYDSLENTKTYVQNKNLAEGTEFSELSYRDFITATYQSVLGVGAGAGVGAVMGAKPSMKEAVDWASSPSGKQYTTTPQGGRSAADELADEPLDAVQATANEAAPMMEEALNQAKYARQLAKENPRTDSYSAKGGVTYTKEDLLDFMAGKDMGLRTKAQREADSAPEQPRSLREQEDLMERIREAESRYAVTETLAGGRPSREAMEQREYLEGLKQQYAEQFSGRPGVGNFSSLDDKPWSLRKSDAELRETQRGWRDASTLGETVDAVTRAGKNFVKDKIWGVDMRLRWEISPELGGRYQMANTKSIRALTQEIEQYVKPMEKIFKLNAEDSHFQAMLLDYGANSKAMSMDRVKSYITSKLSEADAKAFEEYVAWSNKNSYDSLARFSGVKDPKIFTRQHLHSKLTPAAMERKKIDRKADYDDLEIPLDPATLKLQRNFYFDPDPMNTSARPMPSDYVPVLQSDFRRILTNRLAVEVSEAFGMPKIQGAGGPQKYLETMQQHFKDRGIGEAGAEYAVKQIKDHMIGINRSPELWIQALNNGAYGYVLSGFKSAMLNLHDPAMATVNFDVPLTEIPGALYRAYANKAGADVVKSGIDQNLGEFVNQHIQTLQTLSKGGTGTQRWWADKTRQVTNTLMKVGQFERTDIYSKNGTLNVILEQMVREAGDGSFIPKWGFYMPPTKLNKLQLALKKNGADFRKYKNAEEFELVEDMVFAALGQQQLIAGSGRSAAWARNPNLRPMWALRGFASQQQGILMWKVVDNFRKGNNKEAYKYLGMYSTLVAGSYGLLNESRQWLFGDGNFDLTGVFMGMADQIASTASVNTLGMNDYQWGRIMEVGVPQAFFESLVPIAVDVPFSVGEDFVEMIDDGQGPLYPIGQMPIVKQAVNFTQNMATNAADTLKGVSFDQVDVAPYVIDPQQEVLKRVGLMKQLGGRDE
jgi:hypothetical protein